MVAFWILALQYVVFLSLSATWAERNFWWVDLILLIMFAIQTFAVLLRLYYFVFVDSKSLLNNKEASMIRMVDNMIILMALLILWANFIIYFGILNLI